MKFVGIFIAVVAIAKLSIGQDIPSCDSTPSLSAVVDCWNKPWLKQTCARNQYFDERECKCKCFDSLECRECFRNQKWNDHKCTCECPQMLKCPSNKFFSHWSCGCECKQQARDCCTGSKPAKIWDEKLCDCTCARVQICATWAGYFWHPHLCKCVAKYRSIDYAYELVKIQEGIEDPEGVLEPCTGALSSSASATTSSSTSTLTTSAITTTRTETTTLSTSTAPQTTTTEKTTSTDVTTSTTLPTTTSTMTESTTTTEGTTSTSEFYPTTSTDETSTTTEIFTTTTDPSVIIFYPGESLQKGHTKFSSNQLYQMVFIANGNLAMMDLYGNVLFEFGTGQMNSSYAIMSTSGIFAIRDANGNTLWQHECYGPPGSYARIYPWGYSYFGGSLNLGDGVFHNYCLTKSPSMPSTVSGQTTSSQPATINANNDLIENLQVLIENLQLSVRTINPRQCYFEIFNRLKDLEMLAPSMSSTELEIQLRAGYHDYIRCSYYF